MKTKTAQPIYRKDYQVSDFLINKTELIFELGQTHTIVSSTLSIRRNPVSKNNRNTLYLNGVNLELIDVKLDGKTPKHHVDDEALVIQNCPDQFTLHIQTKIYPQKNTSLNGLYQSSGNFCTQCEAHGFRQITYYLDRPDVLSTFTTTIIADKDNYPVLLSNGNLIKSDPNSVVWHDPHPKPCYLFALVAGNLAVLEDTFTTQDGRAVSLQIYVEPHNLHKTQFAMQSLKRAFKWDEDRFGLRYDLDTYMIVAVDDFNMGAMENKGLNIFNSSCVLADPDTATDNDFINIEAIIGHEYFHNWTGNRVTCRDWFQLSLKEGLTVFRDQEFTADLHDRTLKRIDDVDVLRSHQFLEDSGPMSHPVRPESYIEMNNFYTVTVYEKGAELVRMIHTLLGEAGFQKGMKRYISLFDGQAVTIDDFVQAMADANQTDLTQFKRWYSQKGTPEVNIDSHYDNTTQTLTIDCEQNIGNHQAFVIPITYGILGDNGSELTNGVMTLTDTKQRFVFDNISSKPTLSLLRGFSAPIKLKHNTELNDKLFLLEHDSDFFNRWDTAQTLWLEQLTQDKFKTVDQHILNSFEQLLIQWQNDASNTGNTNTNINAITAEIVTLPSEKQLHQHFDVIDVSDIYARREALINLLANTFKKHWLDIYHTLNSQQTYQFKPEAVANRSLKNLALFYLSYLGEFKLIVTQFERANNMTDKMAAFTTLMRHKNDYQQGVIESFYQHHQNDVQVMDKWFAAQAISASTNATDIKQLMQHHKFSFTNPNRLRSVVSSFTQNYCQFHTPEGYQLLTDVVLKLDKINPQIGARLVSVFNHWKRYSLNLSVLQQQQLTAIADTNNLSNDIFEIVQNALK